MQKRYWLSQDCFVCVAGDSLVCLNISRNSWHVLQGALANAVQGHITGWPRVEVEEEGSYSPEDVLADLLRRRIIVANPSRGKSAAPIEVAPPERELIAEYEKVPATIERRDLANFVRAALLVSLPGLSRRIARRVSGAFPARRSICPLDHLAMLSVYGAFERLRPFLWRRRNQIQCEQFVLLRMLEYRGFDPQWIWAVSTYPYRKNSWIQCGGVVIDAVPSAISRYVPILAV